MKITKTDLEKLVSRLNKIHGFNDPEWNTIGSYHLHISGYGISIEKIKNEFGAASLVAGINGMSKQECYYFLIGLLEGGKQHE